MLETTLSLKCFVKTTFPCHFSRVIFTYLLHVQKNKIQTSAL